MVHSKSSGVNLKTPQPKTTDQEFEVEKVGLHQPFAVPGRHATGQFNHESGPAFGRQFETDCSFMVANDSLADRQAEPRSCFASCEKRLKSSINLPRKGKPGPLSVTVTPNQIRCRHC
jgi:hypothetical protein